MKKFGKIAGILVGILIVVFIARNFIVASVMKAGIKSMVGLRLDIGKLDIGAFSTHVGIKEMKLYNPDKYPEPLFVDLPEIFVDYNLKSILSGKIEFSEIRLNLKELNVVKDKDGNLNIDELKAIAKTDASQKPEKDQQAKKSGKAPEIKIDKLRLKIGTVYLKDYSRKGDKPYIQEFAINLDEEHNDITNPNTLVSLIVFKALTKTSISSLVNFDVKGLGESLGGSLFKTGQMATDVVGKTTEILGGTAGDVTNKVTDLLKKPFGK